MYAKKGGMEKMAKVRQVFVSLSFFAMSTQRRRFLPLSPVVLVVLKVCLSIPSKLSFFASY